MGFLGSLFDYAMDYVDNNADKMSAKLDQYEKNNSPNDEIRDKINEKRQTISDGKDAVRKLRSIKNGKKGSDDDFEE